MPLANTAHRIIGMAKGRVVFDGAPGELTPAVLREIYQVEGHEADLPEEITSTTGWLVPQSRAIAAVTA